MKLHFNSSSDRYEPDFDPNAFREVCGGRYCHYCSFTSGDRGGLLQPKREHRAVGLGFRVYIRVIA